MDVEQLITKYDALATQVAPDVMEKMLEATTLGGIGYLIMGALLLSFWGIIMYLAYRLNRKFDDMDDNLATQVLTMVLATLFLFVPGMLMVADLWNWVAIWRPDLALTHQFINNLGSSK